MNWERDEEQEQEAMELAARIEAETEQVAQQFNTPAQSQQPAPVVPIIPGSPDEIRAFQMRLDHAELYKALLSQPLFAEDSGNPALVKLVEDEIKGFVVGRLKILLGMGEPKKPEQNLPPYVLSWLKGASKMKLMALDTLLAKITGEPLVPASQEDQSEDPAPKKPTINKARTAPVTTAAAAQTGKKKAQTQPNYQYPTNQNQQNPQDRAPVIDPSTGEKRPNPRNAGQVKPPVKPLPMPDANAEAAKILSDVASSKAAMGADPLSTALMTKVLENASKRGDE